MKFSNSLFRYQIIRVAKTISKKSNNRSGCSSHTPIQHHTFDCSCSCFIWRIVISFTQYNIANFLPEFINWIGSLLSTSLFVISVWLIVAWVTSPYQLCARKLLGPDSTHRRQSSSDLLTWFVTSLSA